MNDTYLELEDAVFDRIIQFSAKDVTPSERHKLRHLIRHYMSKPHPFTACYRDNVKRFGPDRAKRVCAVLKDIGKGTTKWRKGNQKFSEDNSAPPEVTDKIAKILDDASQDKEFTKFLRDLAK